MNSRSLHPRNYIRCKVTYSLQPGHYICRPPSRARTLIPMQGKKQPTEVHYSRLPHFSMIDYTYCIMTKLSSCYMCMTDEVILSGMPFI